MEARHVVCLSTTYSVCSVVFYTIFRQMYNNKTTWLTEIVDSRNNNNNFVFFLQQFFLVVVVRRTTFMIIAGWLDILTKTIHIIIATITIVTIFITLFFPPLPLSGLGAISLFHKPYLLSNLKANSVEVFSSQPLYSVCLCIRFPLLVFVWPTRLYLSIHPSNFEKYPRYFIFSRK